MLRADGAITIGAPGAIGALPSEQARRELAAQLERNKQEYQTLERRQQQATQHIADLESQIADLDEGIRVAAEETSRVEQETVAKTRTQVAVAEETLRGHQATQDREKALLARLDNGIGAILTA